MILHIHAMTQVLLYLDLTFVDHKWLFIYCAAYVNKFIYYYTEPMMNPCMHVLHICFVSFFSSQFLTEVERLCQLVFWLCSDNLTDLYAAFQQICNCPFSKHSCFAFFLMFLLASEVSNTFSQCLTHFFLYFQILVSVPVYPHLSDKLALNSSTAPHTSD